MQNDSRIHAVDALRGFAFLGILIVNIMVFSSVFYGLEVQYPGFPGPFHQAFRFVVSLFFETKFYLLFSFLFGYSVTLQMQSAQKAGASFELRLARRQCGLWLIGAFHAFVQGRVGDRARAWLARAGRMALSSDLSQSLVCSMVFYGIGLGAIGRLPPAAAVGVGLLLYAAQLQVSRWWLRRFSYGPVEWMLRAVTMWGWPAWRVETGINP